MGKNIFWCTSRFNTGSILFQYLPQFESIGIASYSDDTTPYVCYENIDLISGKLRLRKTKCFKYLMKMVDRKHW